MPRSLYRPRSTALTAAKRTPRAPRIAAVRVVGLHHCPETGGWMESKTTPTLPRAFAATAWMRSLLSTGPLALGTSGAVIRRYTRTVSPSGASNGGGAGSAGGPRGRAGPGAAGERTGQFGEARREGERCGGDGGAARGDGDRWIGQHRGAHGEPRGPGTGGVPEVADQGVSEERFGGHRVHPGEGDVVRDDGQVRSVRRRRGRWLRDG